MEERMENNPYIYSFWHYLLLEFPTVGHFKPNKTYSKLNLLILPHCRENFILLLFYSVHAHAVDEKHK